MVNPAQPPLNPSKILIPFPSLPHARKNAQAASVELVHHPRTPYKPFPTSTVNEKKRKLYPNPGLKTSRLRLQDTASSRTTKKETTRTTLTCPRKKIRLSSLMLRPKLTQSPPPRETTLTEP